MSTTFDDDDEDARLLDGRADVAGLLADLERGKHVGRAHEAGWHDPGRHLDLTAANLLAPAEMDQRGDA